MDIDEKVYLTTPVGLQKELARLEKMICGKYPKVWISICPAGMDFFAFHDFLNHNDGQIAHVNSESFQEAVKIGETAITTWIAVSREKTIRKLALAIIEATDEHTHCTVALLRAKGFSVSQITEYHIIACARASEMCANAPFVVEGV